MQNFKVFVGIDISKDSFSVCAISSPQFVLFEASFPMSYSGFSSFINKLSQFPKNSILIAKEFSGCYYINLFAFLSEKNFYCTVLNPLLVNKFYSATLRKTKTDRLDAKAIAITLYHIHPHLPKDSFLQSDFRDIARRREKLPPQLAKAKNDIEKLLSVLSPELERKVNIYNVSVLRFLEQFPSAYAVKHAPIGKLNSALFLREYCEKAAACQDVEFLKSIKGIGDTITMHFVAEVGPIKRFSNHKKLIVYCGLDPTVYQSGRFEGKSKISKRENRHLRRVVWLMTIGVVRYNKYFRNYFKRRKAEGLTYKKAILTTAYKLLRTISAMLNKGQPFSVTHCHHPYLKEVNFS